MNTLPILNEGPYGNERSYNPLRSAGNLVMREDVSIRVFLIGDGVASAMKGQHTPDGYYNIERMLKGLAREGAELAV